MKRSLSICFAALALLASGLVPGGCTYNLVELGEKKFPLERADTNPIYVSWVSAEEKDGGMIIRGMLSTNSSHVDGAGHIDVAVFSPGGELLGQTSTDYAPKEFRKYRREAHFESHFAFVPPDGSRIRLKLHNSSILELKDNYFGDSKAAEKNVN